MERQQTEHPMQVVWQVVGGQGVPEGRGEEALSSLASPPKQLVPLWMLETLAFLLLNAVLPLLLATTLVFPRLVKSANARLPRFLVWEDILGVSPDKLQPRRMPRWKWAGFVALGLAGAAVSAVGVVQEFVRAGDVGEAQGFPSWAPLAQAFATTIVWLITTAHVAFRPSPTPVYPAFAIHFSLCFADVLNVALAFAAFKAVHLQTLLRLAILLALLALHLSLPVNALPDDTFADPPGIGGRSPEEEASLWSWISYSFMAPLFELGWGKKLEDEEVWHIGPLRATGPSRERFSYYREKHPDRSLFRCIVFLNIRGILGDFICSVACVFLAYAAPFCLKQVLDAIEDPSPAAVRTAYLFAATALAATLLKVVLSGFSRRCGSGAEIRTRGALMSAIYYKALKRKDFSGVVSHEPENSEDKVTKKPATGADIGKIVSLMSNDVVKISNRITNASDLYSPPIEIVVASIFLYQLLGLSAFAGAAGLLVLLPFNTHLRNRAVKINKHNVEARDVRMTVMNELVLSIKPLKFFAWEERWMGKALKAREKEMKWILAGRTNAVLFNFVWGLSPILITLISFWCFVTLGHGQLTVSTAFTALSLYQMLAGPLGTIPSQLVVWAQSKLSLDRLEAFLAEPEVPDFVTTLRSTPPPKIADKRLAIRDGVFRWLSSVDDVRDENAFQLEVDVEFPQGKLTVLSGPVGSGKTALLLALLGELDCVSGNVFLPKTGRTVAGGFTQSVAYAAQSPFLQGKSIRENILFGEPFDEHRYNAVLYACHLFHDLLLLEDGDATEIGPRGVVLSGGQKARLAVARVLYSKAAVCLLDDPLAALDVGTTRHLVDCLVGPLMKGRTMVLATHHLDIVLPRSDYLVKLESGRIVLQGSIDSLRAQGLLPSVLAEDAEHALVNAELPDDETAKEEAFDAAVKQAAARPLKTARKLVEAEERSEKNVSWDIYRLYVRASGLALWILTALLLCVHQGSSVLSRFWLKVWGEAYSDQGAEYLGLQLPSALEKPLFYLSIYAGISFGILLISVTQISVSYLAAYRAAVSLHDRLLLRVVKATVRSFDTIPAGRLLNRFSADVAALDGNLAITLRTTLAWTASGIASVAVIIAVEPYFVGPAFFLALSYGYLSVKYARTSRDLRRMMSTARSPLFASFGELLEGITTVRSFAREGWFLAAFEKDVDDLISKIYWNWATNRWLTMRFDALGAVATFLSMIFAIMTSTSSGSSALAITSTQSFVSALYWLCRNVSALEMAFNAVERVSEYLQLPQEAPWVIEGARPPAAWPTSHPGKPFVEVKSLVVKYNPDLPSVLHGVSFDVRAGERIGLVGRTGSGKSTLALSLLRFTDPSAGQILIDGVDITKIGVRDLRQRVTYVPQDANALFKGTIRSNLDPAQQYTDAELLYMLRRVHLITPSAPASSAASVETASEPEPSTSTGTSTSTLVPSSTALSEPPQCSKVKLHLDTPVSSGGTSLSAGQRQLLALARALLRNSNLLIMDEATSGIDHATDVLVQETLRAELPSDCTMLVIAHRLSTVIDMDRLLVLQDGRIAEFDTPTKLLEKEGGVLRSMVLEAEPGTLDELLALSRRHEANK